MNLTEAYLLLAVMLPLEPGDLLSACFRFCLHPGQGFLAAGNRLLLLCDQPLRFFQHCMQLSCPALGLLCRLLHILQLPAGRLLILHAFHLPQLQLGKLCGKCFSCLLQAAAQILLGRKCLFLPGNALIHLLQCPGGFRQQLFLSSKTLLCLLHPFLLGGSLLSGGFRQCLLGSTIRRQPDNLRLCLGQRIRSLSVSAFNRSPAAL